MKRRGVRIGALVVFLVALGAGLVQVLQIEQEMSRQRVAAQTLDDGARKLLGAVAELGAAQRAYVAAGQGQDFWIEKVDSTIAAVIGGLGTMREQLSATGAVAAAEAVSGTLDSFKQMDAQVREYVRGNQLLTASDLIFADGLELVRTMAHQVEAAREAEQGARTLLMARDRRAESYVVGGSAVLSLMVVLLLMPVSRSGSESERGKDVLSLGGTGQTGEGRIDPLDSLSLHGSGSDASGSAGTGFNLRGAADLCTDFARVAEAQEIPPLLQRSAGVLDASGVIVWLRGSTSDELRPALAHGYGAQSLSRLGTIRRDAENPAAVAYRTAQTQVVKGSGATHGAIVAPLIGPAGCVGVVSVELRGGHESRPSIQALTRILAAQIVSLVAVTPAATGYHSQAAGR